MRWRSRDEPLGSHHVDARALKCDTSVGLTEDAVLWTRNWFCTNRGADRRRRLRLRREVGRSDDVFIVTNEDISNRACVSDSAMTRWRRREEFRKAW